MKIYQEADYSAISRRAADMIAGEIICKPDCVLGLATGATPIGAYEELTARYRQGAFSFQKVRTVNLDEYKGLEPTHPKSYRHFMEEHLFSQIDVDPANTYLPNGLAPDADAECVRYDALLASLGYADLQVLGLGRNGHIGFNEPGESFLRDTHVVDLTQSTIEANARFFARSEDVPRQAITMGIGGIMAARRVLLLVSGEEKAEALYRTVCGSVTPRCPASVLQLHRDVAVVADCAALKLFTEKGKHICG